MLIKFDILCQFEADEVSSFLSGKSTGLFETVTDDSGRGQWKVFALRDGDEDCPTLAVRLEQGSCVEWKYGGANVTLTLSLLAANGSVLVQPQTTTNRLSRYNRMIKSDFFRDFVGFDEGDSIVSAGWSLVFKAMVQVGTEESPINAESVAGPPELVQKVDEEVKEVDNTGTVLDDKVDEKVKEVNNILASDSVLASFGIVAVVITAMIDALIGR